MKLLKTTTDGAASRKTDEIHLNMDNCQLYKRFTWYLKPRCNTAWVLSYRFEFLGLFFLNFAIFTQVNIQLWPKISSSINNRRWTHQNEKVCRFLDICISYNSPKCWSEQVSAIQDGLGVNEELNRDKWYTEYRTVSDIGGMIRVIELWMVPYSRVERNARHKRLLSWQPKLKFS